MTRDEQMWEAVAQEHGDLSMRDAFVTLTAMEWADKTMVDKACEWLKNNIDLYAYNSLNIKSGYAEITLTDEFETIFKKAMEE